MKQVDRRPSSVDKEVLPPTITIRVNHLPGRSPFDSPKEKGDLALSHRAPHQAVAQTLGGGPKAIPITRVNPGLLSTQDATLGKSAGDPRKACHSGDICRDNGEGGARLQGLTDTSSAGRSPPATSQESQADSPKDPEQRPNLQRASPPTRAVASPSADGHAPAEARAPAIHTQSRPQPALAGPAGSATELGLASAETTRPQPSTNKETAAT